MSQLFCKAHENLLLLISRPFEGGLNKDKGLMCTHVLHTAWISSDERVLYNDTETLIKAAKSFTRFICDTRPTYCLDQMMIQRY